MDHQHRVGHKTGSGQPASAQDIALDRKERLRRLALETVDLSKDPYMLRNHVGKIECRLCLTLHLNESSYLTHTQGRKHQTNLARRAAKEKLEQGSFPPTTAAAAQTARVARPTTVEWVQKIGRPGYRVTKMRGSDTEQLALLFEISFNEVSPGIKPRHRFISAWEQKAEPPDPAFQYVAFAAEPYETIAFRIPSAEIDREEGKCKPPTKYIEQIFMVTTVNIQLHTVEGLPRMYKQVAVVAVITCGLPVQQQQSRFPAVSPSITGAFFWKTAFSFMWCAENPPTLEFVVQSLDSDGTHNIGRCSLPLADLEKSSHLSWHSKKLKLLVGNPLDSKPQLLSCWDSPVADATICFSAELHPRPRMPDGSTAPTVLTTKPQFIQTNEDAPLFYSTATEENTLKNSFWLGMAAELI